MSLSFKLPQTSSDWTLLGLAAAASAAPLAVYAVATAGTRNSLDVVESAGSGTQSKVVMSFAEVALAAAASDVIMPPKTAAMAAFQTGTLVGVYDYYQFQDAREAAMTAAAVALSTLIGRSVVLPWLIIGLTKYKFD